MALRQRKDGEYLDVGTLNHIVDGTKRPISALYQCVGGMMRLVWSAIQYIAAWTHRDAWKHGEPW